MAKIEGIIFDMDGTLTVPILDFGEIRRQIGIDSGPVWEAIVAMAPEQRRRAEEILLRHEIESSRMCELQPGVMELFAELERRKMPMAILTRNCRAAWETLRKRFGFSLDRVYAREDGPMKPDPTPVIRLAKEMNIALANILCVGDYLFDIQAGKCAGTQTALLVNHGQIPDFAGEADYVIHSLLELPTIIDACLTI
ncbi:MAG: HAD family hydrolase [Phycisphaerae bacterium]|nr:HAD family hydrolase [Phycisphaerae bacterium]